MQARWSFGAAGIAAHCPLLTVRLALVSRTSRCLPARPQLPRCLSTPQPVETMAQVGEYIEKHNLQKKVEDALNACVKSAAEDPLSFIVSKPRQRAAPVAVARAVQRARTAMHAASPGA